MKLNASYEALGLIGVPRALSLVARGAVDMIELDGDRVLRSPRFTWAVPSVVRLKVYINVRKYERKGNLRIRIFVRDGFRCQYCGQVKAVSISARIGHQRHPRFCRRPVPLAVIARYAGSA